MREVMKQPSAIVLFLLVLVLGVVAYVLYHSSGAMKKTAVVPPQATTVSLQAPGFQQQESLSAPPPPPRPSGDYSHKSPSEPERTLKGMTSERLKRIEECLPDGSQIATYPVSETEKMAATGSDDLDNDGVIETVVVYSMPGSKNPANASILYLAVLATEQDRLEIRSTTRLYGTFIQNNVFNRKTVPFAIRDATGARRKDIVVTSSQGASLGGVLQIFSFQQSAVRQIANISGDTIEVENSSAGKPSTIITRSRNDKETRIYRWNGAEFHLLSGNG